MTKAAAPQKRDQSIRSPLPRSARLPAQLFNVFSRRIRLEQRVIDHPGHVGRCAASGIKADARRARRRSCPVPDRHRHALPRHSPRARAGVRACGGGIASEPLEHGPEAPADRTASVLFRCQRAGQLWPGEQFRLRLHPRQGRRRSFAVSSHNITLTDGTEVRSRPGLRTGRGRRELPFLSHRLNPAVGDARADEWIAPSIRAGRRGRMHPGKEKRLEAGYRRHRGAWSDGDFSVKHCLSGNYLIRTITSA